MEGERTNPDMNTYSAVIIKTLINVERQHVLNSSCQTTEKYVLLRITMDEYVSTKLHHSRPNAYGTLKLTLCMFKRLGNFQGNLAWTAVWYGGTWRRRMLFNPPKKNCDCPGN